MTEAFLCDYVRTPIGRYGGGLAAVRTDDLAAIPIRELMSRHPGLAEKVEDVFFGSANQAGEDNRNLARMALLLAGVPESVPGVTVNRLCASGMDAVAQAARAIKAGELSVAIAGGCESMTRAPFVMGKAESAFQRSADIYDTTIGWRFVNPLMKTLYGVDSMPETAQNVADDYQISREDQDAFALRSQARAAAAQAKGIFEAEIVAVEIKDRKGGVTRVAKDEHPRADTTREALAKLRGIVRPDGSVTAGNASGVNDGAAALVLASEKAAASKGLTPIARVLGYATAGVAPRVMGVGPVPAVQRLCERLGRNPPTSRRSNSTRPSPRSRSRACGASGFPMTRNTSTQMAARSRSATRSACPARASLERWRWSFADVAGATASPPCASASARAPRWRSSGCSARNLRLSVAREEGRASHYSSIAARFALASSSAARASSLAASGPGERSTTTRSSVPVKANGICVVVARGRAGLHADVGRLVEGDDAALRLVDPALRDLLAVDEDPARAALAEPAAIVGEVELDRRLARGQRLVGGDLIAFEAQPVVFVGRLAVLHIEAPAAEPAALREQNALRPALGNGRRRR